MDKTGSFESAAALIKLGFESRRSGKCTRVHRYRQPRRKRDSRRHSAGLAQLVERLICNQEIRQFESVIRLYFI